MKIYPSLYNLLWDDTSAKDSLSLRIDNVDSQLNVSVTEVFILKSQHNQEVKQFDCKNALATSIDQTMPGLYTIELFYDKIATDASTCVPVDAQSSTLVPALKVSFLSGFSEKHSYINQEVLVPLIITNKNLLEEVKKQITSDAPQKQLILKNMHCDSSFLLIKKDLTCSVTVENISKIPFTYDLSVYSIPTFPWMNESASKKIISGITLFPNDTKDITFTVEGNFVQFGSNIIGVKLAYSNPYLQIPLYDIQGYQLFYISAIVLIIVFFLAIYYIFALRKIIKNKLAARQNGRKTKVTHKKNSIHS